MTKVRLIAFSDDAFWLDAVRAAAEGELASVVLFGHETGAEPISGAPGPAGTDLVLVDASWRPDPVEVVRDLTRRGWRYVVTVAADPSWKEARAVLHDGGGYDYWKKTYRVEAIRADVRRCLLEIEEAPAGEAGWAPEGRGEDHEQAG